MPGPAGGNRGSGDCSGPGTGRFVAVGGSSRRGEVLGVAGLGVASVVGFLGGHLTLARG